MAVFLFTFNGTGKAAVTVEQQLSLGNQRNVVIFNPPRQLDVPTREVSDLGNQWADWIFSVSSPSADNEVSQTTAGILLQIGFMTSPGSDDRWSQLVCRYFTGSGLTDQRKLFMANVQVYSSPPGAGIFHYWRTAWLPLIPGEDLSIQRWFAEPGSTTTPAALLIGTINGDEV
ncbi:MAG: hypothetical protein HYS56_04170 [Candidatus Omnitrophica bacterium]|nr:hypothetical protein [Candidatus Omnitrophota bacterium]